MVFNIKMTEKIITAIFYFYKIKFNKDTKLIYCYPIVFTSCFLYLRNNKALLFAHKISKTLNIFTDFPAYCPLSLYSTYDSELIFFVSWCLRGKCQK